MKPLLWGIDLGGTKTEIAVIDVQDGYRVVYRTRIPTASKKGYRAVLEGICSLVDMAAVETGTRPEYIGIGTPGSLDPHTLTLKNSNSTVLNGMPFRDDLEDMLGMPVRMANDANCFALAETLLGAVKENHPGAKVVFGVIMGTGVGGGIVVNGQVLQGQHGIAGEWGHNVLNASGGPCYCGKTGCVETFISGPALERYYREQSGQSLSLKDIAARNGKDPWADETLQRLTSHFGMALSYIINILDPDVVVLGGGVGNIDLLYTRGVEEVKKHVFNTRFHASIIKPMLGDSAGVFGAALL